MSARVRLSHADKAWQATCPACGWSYRSTILDRAHTEATHHTCKPILGPRPVPGVAMAAGDGSLVISAHDPRGQWWASSHRLEVW